MAQSQVRILIVDDERNIRNNLRMVLEADGYNVNTAASGNEAVLRARETHYDIAFVDIQMPQMSGLELLRQLRALRSKLPVVMLTAYGTVGRAVEAMKLGAVDFVEKPFDPKAIQLLCREILERQKVRPDTTIEDLLKLSALARQRNAYVEARVYLKTAMVRDVLRPEPYYYLGEISELEEDKRKAIQYYSLALDADADYEPAERALNRVRSAIFAKHA
jgi:DNA-binding response OmpR family regulator